jgi:hypothetical protein
LNRVIEHLALLGGTLDAPAALRAGAHDAVDIGSRMLCFTQDPEDLFFGISLLVL